MDIDDDKADERMEEIVATATGLMGNVGIAAGAASAAAAAGTTAFARGAIAGAAAAAQEAGRQQLPQGFPEVRHQHFPHFPHEWRGFF